MALSLILKQLWAWSCFWYTVITRKNMYPCKHHFHDASKKCATKAPSELLKRSHVFF